MGRSLWGHAGGEQAAQPEDYRSARYGWGGEEKIPDEPSRPWLFWVYRVGQPGVVHVPVQQTGTAAEAPGRAGQHEGVPGQSNGGW